MTATFSLSEDARVLYSIRRRRESKPRTTCPGRITRKVPGTSEEIGSQVGNGTTGTNVATIARAERGARTVHGKAHRGRNRVRLAQLVNSLPPGTYLLVVRATDAAGNRSVDMIAKFWVLAPNTDRTGINGRHQDGRPHVRRGAWSSRARSCGRRSRRTGERSAGHARDRPDARPQRCAAAGDRDRVRVVPKDRSRSLSVSAEATTDAAGNYVLIAKDGARLQRLARRTDGWLDFYVSGGDNSNGGALWFNRRITGAGPPSRIGPRRTRARRPRSSRS